MTGGGPISSDQGPRSLAPFGNHFDFHGAAVQVPTAASNLGCTIRTDGLTVDFPGNNTGDRYPDWDSGVFMITYQANFTTAVSGAYTFGGFVFPVTGSMLLLNTFKNQATNNHSGPQIGYNGTGAGVGVIAIASSWMIAITNNTVAGGQCFRVDGTGVNWPTTCTSADLWIISMPSSFSPIGMSEADIEADEEEQIVERAAKRRKMKETLMLQFMAKASGVELPEGLLDSDSEMEDEGKSERKAPSISPVDSDWEEPITATRPGPSSARSSKAKPPTKTPRGLSLTLKGG